MFTMISCLFLILCASLAIICQKRTRVASHINLLLFVGLCATLYLFSGVMGCAGPKGGDTEEDTLLFPETCAEVQENAIDETGERPSDGTYTLYIDGDESQPWDAYCYNMNRAEPVEYLTVNESDNYSEIGDGTLMATTTYRRIRINPTTLELYPLDDTFATSDFDTFQPTLPNDIDFIPLAWAEIQPTGFNSSPGYMASVDLTDTPFVFNESINDEGYFCMFTNPETLSYETEGTGATVASDLKSFSLTAVNIDSQMMTGAYTREVADCANLNAADVENVDSAVIPLTYVGD